MHSGGRRINSRGRAPGAVTLIAVAILRSTLQAAPVAPPEPPLRIDLAPGSLQQALASLAERTGLQILYAQDLLQGLTTRGLHGVMTPAEALRRLLASTDISFEFTARDAVALREDKEPGPHAEPLPAPARTVIISTARDRNNGVSSSTSLTTVKVDESSLLVPITSSSLTQQTFRDQQVTRLEDALEYVSATEIAPDGHSSAGFEIHGFPTYQYYLDGVRVSPDLHRDGFPDLADVDHVDIMKGPASLLYGRTEPGGLVNVVTKQPPATALVSIEQRTGSFGRTDTLLDAGGPLSSGQSLLYRLNTAWESGGSFRQVPRSRRIFLAPVLTWSPSQRTETTAYLTYLDSHDPSDSGIPIIGNRIPAVPISRSLDEGGEVHTTDLRVGARGSHTFQDGWTLHHHLDMRWLDTPQAPQVALAADGLDPNQCSASDCPVKRLLFVIPISRGYTRYASVEMTRDLRAWGTRHSLLLGVELFQTASYSHLEIASDPSLTTDLFHPGSMAIPLSLLQEPDQGIYRNARERWTAAYVQDQVSFGDDFYLLVGVRFDSASASIGQMTLGSLTGVSPPGVIFPALQQESGLQIQMVKHREGLVWHPVPSLSFYALHTENFGAVPGLYVGADGYSGVYLPPQSAAEWETGVKFAPTGGRFAATVAAFDLMKENVSSTILEPALDPTGALFFTGTVRNKGLEVDVRGEMLPGLQYLANFAYIDSRIFFVPSAIGGELVGSTGNRFFGVPRNGGSAWLSYQFSDGAAHGLKLGAGVIARSAREGDNANDYELPGFAKWDAFTAYGWRVGETQLSVQLNVDNLFNARYFESVNGTHTVMPAYPRRWLASLRVQF